MSAAASGHPAAGVAWLAEQLATRGRAVEPGDLIITGGLTSARPPEAGHRVGAVFGDGRWSVDAQVGGQPGFMRLPSNSEVPVA